MSLTLTIARFELKQRSRSVAWLVLMGVAFLVLLGTTLMLWIGLGEDRETFGWVTHSVVTCLALLLVLVLSPTLSGNAINGDREHALLASLQVTEATTGHILFGKLLAAIATGLGFVLVSVPFVVFAGVVGNISPLNVLLLLLVLAIEVVVIAAIGVGVSGLIARSLFSVAAAYLVVAALLFGSPILFGLASSMDKVEVHTVLSDWVYDDQGDRVLDSDGEPVCEVNESTYVTTRTDRTWWLLAPNPYVILGDMTRFPERHDDPETTSLFYLIKSAVRSAQLPPVEHEEDDFCTEENELGPGWESTAQEDLERLDRETVPVWWAGLTLQALVAALLVWGAYRRTRVPARTMPPGSRIA